MPPAFNLSQDQTLQFNPNTSNSIDVGPIPTQKLTPPSQDKTHPHPITDKSNLRRVSTTMSPASASKTRAPPTNTSKHHSTHTYRLQTVKEQAARAPGLATLLGKRCSREARLYIENGGRQHPSFRQLSCRERPRPREASPHEARARPPNPPGSDHPVSVAAVAKIAGAANGPQASRYPCGFIRCQRQASAHISSMPRVARHPSSSAARATSAKQIAASPGRRGPRSKGIA